MGPVLGGGGTRLEHLGGVGSGQVGRHALIILLNICYFVTIIFIITFQGLDVDMEHPGDVFRILEPKFNLVFSYKQTYARGFDIFLPLEVFCIFFSN